MGEFVAKTDQLIFEVGEILEKVKGESAKFPSVDSRRDARLPIVTRVTRSDGKSCYWKTVNISAGGFFVEGTPVEPVGRELDVRLWLPDEVGNIELGCRAEVMWNNIPGPEYDPKMPTGMGLAFRQLEDAHHEVLAKFLEKRRPNGRLLDSLKIDATPAPSVAAARQAAQEARGGLLDPKTPASEEAKPVRGSPFADDDQAWEDKTTVSDIPEAVLQYDYLFDHKTEAYLTGDEEHPPKEAEAAADDFDLDVEGVESAEAADDVEDVDDVDDVEELDESEFIELKTDDIQAVPGSVIKGEPQPGDMIGGYRIIEQLGRGGMGTVYLVEHVQLGRQFALKRIHPNLAGDPDIVRRFFDEARRISQLEHHHIVQVTDFIDNPEHTCFVMELVRGVNLAVLQERGPLPYEDVLSIGIQLCDVLEVVHRGGIVHRDLKPANIILTERAGRRNFVKLLDFGIAKFFDPLTGANQGYTQVGMSLGTPGYSSPEQLLGDNCDHRTDIYALGVMLYEMVTGQKPFVADTLPKLMLAQTTESPERPSRLSGTPFPVALESLILTCLKRDPDERPQTMAQLREHLEMILGGDTPPSIPHMRRQRRHNFLAYAAVGVAVALAGWLGLDVFGDELAKVTEPMFGGAVITDVGPPSQTLPAYVADLREAAAESEAGQPVGDSEVVEPAGSPPPRPAVAPAKPGGVSKPNIKRKRRPRRKARGGADRDSLGSFFEQFE